MKSRFNWDFIYPSQRMPILARNIVSTSQPLASQAGLQMILKGGNAVDAALAAAITLTVVEPTMNGIGSDAFAILWDGKKIVGLNASGRSPASWEPDLFSHLEEMPLVGWGSVTVPGAVSAWIELSKRYGQLSFKELFEPAIEYAEKGFLVSPITAEHWDSRLSSYKESIPKFKENFPEFYNTFYQHGRAPKQGEICKLPNHAKTLREIAKTEGESFYYGNLAKSIVEYAQNSGGYFTFEDFENHKVTWEKCLTFNYKDVTIHEIPPNGQGLATLIMLGIIKQFDLSLIKSDSPDSLHLQIEAMKLAFSDAYRYISDQKSLEIDPEYLLNSEYLKQRANMINLKKVRLYDAGIPKQGDTVYLTTADSEGMMVSFIQSNYAGFGSCIVVPNTGISLQNRGNGFSLVEGHPNQVGPSKRPFHTIIPAFVTKKDTPLMSFGVMGGSMQPQGHAQLLIRIFEYGQNPQVALDAPRWRISDGFNVHLESGFKSDVSTKLTQLGHQISLKDYTGFGGGQLIYKLEDGYLGASDWRKDGQAVGF
ncbi:MAG: gamma-glutamyltransferase [Candidatus Lokiarchaeota archaeon]|nr:gamma-glutamyltransferase [Candidatus Lokiarchaeota archaeon]